MGFSPAITSALTSIATVSCAVCIKLYYNTIRTPKLLSAEQLIAQRRSVYPRQYDSLRPVPKKIIERMLESANWAPTHARTEPWRFTVFSSQRSRRELGELEGDLYEKMTPTERFSPTKYQKKIDDKLRASHIIAICMKRQETEKIPEMDEVCSVACAVQNMHLTATSYNVGAYWSSGSIASSDEMKRFLGLGEKDRCLGFFYVGYPKGELPKGRRRPTHDKVQWR